MAQWEVLDLGDVVPSVIKDTIDVIQSVLAPITAILELIQTILNIIRTFLILFANPLLALIEAIGNDIKQFLDDLAAAGLYALYDFPQIRGADSVSKFNSLFGGGSAAFKQRVSQSFFDPYDTNKPAFSATAQVGGIVLAFDNQDIGQALAAFSRITRLFSKQMDGWLAPPKSFTVFPGDKNGEIKPGLVTLIWRDDLSIAVPNGGYIIEFTSVAPGPDRFEEEETVPTLPNKTGGGSTRRVKRDRTTGKRIEKTAVFLTKEISFSLTGRYTEELELEDFSGSVVYIRLRPKSPFGDNQGEATREIAVSVPDSALLPIASDVKITSSKKELFNFGVNSNVLSVGVWTEPGDNIPGTLGAAKFLGTNVGQEVQSKFLRSSPFHRLELCTGVDLTAAQLAADINDRAPFNKDIQATAEDGNLVLFSVKPGPNQVIGVGDSSANEHLLFDSPSKPVGRKAPVPNWDRVSVQDIFPFIKDISKLIKSLTDALVEALRSAVDSVIDFIDLISAKIDQLQRIIDELNDFLDIINELFIGELAILRIAPEPGGTAKFINTFQTATGGPSSDENGITFGLVFLVGGPSAADQYGSLLIFF